MKELPSILQEITYLTSNIETNYPELYKFLEENPTTIPTEGQPDIDEKTMLEYLQSLKHLLRHYLETRKPT